jgi:parallel beta-helix repeat protein
VSRKLYKNPFIRKTGDNNLVLVVKDQAGGKIALGIILMLFFSSLFASALIKLSGAETTETVMWIVDDDGSAADFSSMQAAIDAAKFGDTVYVRSGHYYEHVLVNKGVKLLGENKTSTLIDGNFTDNVVTVAADNVEISGFTIQNSGKRIVANESSPIPEIISENMYGVYVSGYTGCNISGNVVSNNYVGLGFESCFNILISENQIANNYGDCGIFITTSSSVTLSKNNITLNHIDGVVIKQCSASTVSENQIVENPQSGMVICFFSRFITVSKNNITGNSYHGLNLGNAYENSVFGNNICSNYYGICFSGGSSNKVYENYMQANYYAVALFNSPNDQVYNNKLVNNTNDVYSVILASSSSGPFFPPPSDQQSSPQTAPSSDSHVNIRILSPTSGFYQMGLYEAVTKIPLRFTVNEPVSWMAYSLDNKANVTLTGNTTLTISFLNSHSVVVYAKDAEGNTYSSDLVNFRVASTPSVSINSPKNATTYTTSDVPVSITAFVPITGIEFIKYRLEGTSYSGVINGTQLYGNEIEGTAVLSDLPNGNYTLIAVAHAWLTGAVGSSTVYFTVDSLQPASSPSQSLSSSQSSGSPVSQGYFSFSSQSFSNDNPILSTGLSTKEKDYGKVLMFIVAIVGIRLFVSFKKRNRKSCQVLI